MKYIDADRLKAEIEKRMHICDGVFERDSDTYYQGKAVAYQETLSFIDSLQQEHPSLPSNLDEAAMDIVIKMHPCLKNCSILGDRLTRGQLIALVKAGAEWQKEQMLKNAVEGEIQMRYSGCLCAKTIRAINEDKFKLGDKVRIIIVKEGKK